MTAGAESMLDGLRPVIAAVLVVAVLVVGAFLWRQR
jgi:hypothetical protein